MTILSAGTGQPWPWVLILLGAAAVCGALGVLGLQALRRDPPD